MLTDGRMAGGSTGDMINGYLLVDFFSSEVNGVLFSSVVGVFAAAYVAFIIYLVSRGVTRQSKSVTETEN